MRSLPLILVWSLVSGQSAEGAAAELCRPYARATTDVAITFIWLRAYSTCLNADEMPALSRSALDVLSLIDPRRGEEPPPTEPPPTAAPLDSGQDPAAAAPGSVPAFGQSGFPAGSPGWVKFCKENWPRSFRLKDGTVVRAEDARTHIRRPCPG